MASQEELELIQKINQELAKEIEYEAQVRRLRGESVDKLVTQRDILLAQREQFTLGLEYLQSSLEQNQRILDIEEKRLQNLTKESDSRRKATQEEIDAQQRKVDLLQSIRDLQDKIKNGTDEEKAIAEEKIKKLNEELEVRKKIVDSQQAGIKAGASLVEQASKLVGFNKDIENTLTGNFIKALSTGEGFKSVVNAIGEEMKETFGPANALQFFVSNTIQVAKALDNLQADFVAATGASREFASSIEDVFRDNVQFGISLEEASKAVTTLRTDFGAFSNLSKASQDSAAGLAALLGDLGVSASVTANNFEFLVSQLGFGIEEAEDTIRTFTETGASIGIPPEQLNSAFQSLAPRLSAFGKNAPKVFMETAKTAKSLGMTVDELGNTLFALSDSMDTFSETANVAATTNLALGGSFVNAFDLTMAAAEGPTAQVNMLRDAFDAAGKSLGDMGFFEQKFFADAFGVSLSDLTQVIDGNMTMQEAQAKQNPLEELAKQANDALDKLNNNLQSISAGLQPLIKVFNVVAENIKGITFFVVGLVTATKALAAAQAINTIATNAGVAANAGMLTKLVAAIKAKAALKTMNISAAGSTGILTKAQLLLNKAMLANPVGMIAVAVAALGGAIYGLINNFDGVLGYFDSFFGDLGGMFDSFGGFIKGLIRIIMLPFDALYGVISGVAQAIIDLFNLFGADIETPEMFKTSLSSMVIDVIPGLQTGGQAVTSGMALVGEAGPELVNLPKGAQVVNNQSTTEVMKKIEETSTNVTNNTTSANESAMLQALLRIEKALGETQTAGPGTPMQPINVSVKLDKKKVGEATVDYINKSTNVFQSN